ncbi:hypothetical protein SCLCIDRAFT_599995 [Scleroderma citrinum Foug A]|uniref:DUF6533 domain-containing protein n=1 Tax=Scleroderma citrinum Foug A TaxID=1036808 RepID=A0A0C3E931_9AGAM|nr:hypothetical protein SCLCIDRAFT_599995 [Scleroderma citrinum Foug A]
MVLNAFWKTQTDNHFIRMGPLGPLIHSQLDINVSFTIVYFTVVLYDYTLTISREIELFWKRPGRSWSFTTLFIASRYIAILGHTPFLVYSFWSPESQSDYRHHTRCNPIRLIDQVMIGVIQVIGMVVMAARVCAFYQNNRLVLIFLIMLWLGVVAVGCWAVLSSHVISSRPTDLPSLLQSTGNIGCPFGSYLSSKQ